MTVTSPSTPATKKARVLNVRVGFSRPLWWILFAADAILMSWFLQCFKTFTTAASTTDGMMLAVATFCFFACTTALIYDGYAREKEKGQVKNTVALFERFYAAQANHRHLRQNNPRRNS